MIVSHSSRGVTTRSRVAPPVSTGPRRARTTRDEYFKTPLAFVSRWLGTLSPKASVLLLYLLRWTVGWGNMTVSMSQRDLMEGRANEKGCGLKHKLTLREAIRELEDHGLIRVVSQNGRYGQMCNEYTILPAFWGAGGGSKSDPGGSESDPGGSESDPGGSESDPGGSNFDPGGSEFDPGGSEFDQGGSKYDLAYIEKDHENIDQGIYNNNNHDPEHGPEDLAEVVVALSTSSENDGDEDAADAALGRAWHAQVSRTEAPVADRDLAGQEGAALAEMDSSPVADLVAASFAVAPGETAAVVERMVKVGVARPRAEEILQRFPREVVMTQLDYLPHRKAADPAALLVRAISEDYPPPRKALQTQREAVAQTLRHEQLQAMVEGPKARQQAEAETAARVQALIDQLPLEEQRRLEADVMAAFDAEFPDADMTRARFQSSLRAIRAEVVQSRYGGQLAGAQG